MSIDELARWSSLAMPILMGLSSAIAVMVFRSSRRQAHMDALRLVHSRWQEINRIIIERPQVQRLLDDERFKDKTDNEIIAINFLFQIVNACHEIHFASIRGLIDLDTARRFLDGNADVLRGRRLEVLEILGWNRGYDPDFCEALRSRLG